MFRPNDPHFLSFIKTLKGLLDDYDKNTTEFQQKQVEGLLAAERAFRSALIHHPDGAEVYKKFIDFIVVTKHNILTSRPFFRERDTTFKEEISPALRDGNFRRLFRFDINYQFINFALKLGGWDSNIIELSEQVKKIRKELIECNLPLAISRAKMFHAHNNKGHLQYMDLVQIAVAGLTAGVDKFVGAYTTNFRAVLIGRIIGELIEANSETLFHFFPQDKRTLYRVRKIIAGFREGVNEDELIELLNKKEVERAEPQTSLVDLRYLVGAASVVSASTLPLNSSDEDCAGIIENYATEVDQQPDYQLEAAQIKKEVAKSIESLSILEQKILRLSGINLLMDG